MNYLCRWLTASPEFTPYVKNGIMKKQYLGDSKDSFAWYCHDYLTSTLRYQKQNLVVMLAPDSHGSEGAGGIHCD